MKISLLHFVIAAGAIAVCTQPARADLIVLTANLTADQVVAGSSSTATGFATVTIDTALFTITTDLSWSGLSGPADRAHLHNAPFGGTTDDTFFHEVLDDDSVGLSNEVACDPEDPGDPNFGPVGMTMCAAPTGSTYNILQLQGPGDGYGFADFATLVSVFLDSGVYIDVHTELYPEGEIRGQLNPVPEPSSLAMFGAGLLGLGLLRRRRRA